MSYQNVRAYNIVKRYQLNMKFIILLSNALHGMKACKCLSTSLKCPEVIYKVSFSSSRQRCVL